MATILHTEASMGWGGQEIRIFRESLGMINRGHKIFIAAPEQSIIFERAQAEGMDVLPVIFQKKNPLSVINTASLISRIKPDIINTHSSSDSWVTSLAAKFCSHNSKIIRTRHLSTPISRSYLSRLIYNVLPDIVMTTGEEIRQNMINRNGFNPSKILSIPTGIDLDQFNPAMNTPSLPTENFSIGMIGVLRSWKGHNYFLEAVPEIMRKIPETVIYIAGDGPMRESIEQTIKKLSLQDSVTLLGHREDIPSIMASLDVIVHPSYANEGVPQSLLQAMAMKKPVVASDAGAIKEIVHNGKTGFLIEPRNPAQIAEKVIELYRNEELRNSFGKEGRYLVENQFSFQNMLDKIENIYIKLLSNA